MTGPPVEIRAAVRSDAEALLPLFEAFYGPYLGARTVDAVAERLTEAASVDTVLMAMVRGTAIGFASVRLLPQVESDVTHAELSDIYVVPDHRLQGVGQALLRAAEALALSRGARSMYLTVGRDNDDAQAFYRAAGFEDFAVSMKKALEARR